MKTYPRTCYHCKKRTVYPHYETREREWLFEGRHVNVVAWRSPCEKCKSCGCTTYGNDSDDAMIRALQHAMGLLEPGDLLAARKSAGLTEAMAAALLGVTCEDIERWESGRTVPSTKYSDAMKRVLEVVDGKA